MVREDFHLLLMWNLLVANSNYFTIWPQQLENGSISRSSFKTTRMDTQGAAEHMGLKKRSRIIMRTNQEPSIDMTQPSEEPVLVRGTRILRVQTHGYQWTSEKLFCITKLSCIHIVLIQKYKTQRETQIHHIIQLCLVPFGRWGVIKGRHQTRTERMMYNVEHVIVLVGSGLKWSKGACMIHLNFTIVVQLFSPPLSITWHLTPS